LKPKNLKRCEKRSVSSMMANLSLEPTRNGRSLQTPTSFWAFRAQPPLAAQLQR
jgi:hypothetical protein